MRTITLKWLQEQGACEEQQKIFGQEWGSSVKLSKKSLKRAVELKLSLLWLVYTEEEGGLLSKEAVLIFEDLTAETRHIFDKAIAQPYRIWQKAMKKAAHVFDEEITEPCRVCDEAMAEKVRCTYREKMAEASRVYDEAIPEVRHIYREAVAKALWLVLQANSEEARVVDHE